jgi:hypothetical protein
MEENGWEILKGNKLGDEEGEWTYIGNRGETVIGYRIVNKEASERVKEYRIGKSSVGPSPAGNKYRRNEP